MGSPATGTADTAAEAARKSGFGTVRPQKKGMMMHSSRMHDMNRQAGEPVESDVQFIRDRGISQRVIAPEPVAIDTAATAAAAGSDSANYTAQLQPIDVDIEPDETHAPANNTDSASKRQQQAAEASGAHSCHPNMADSTSVEGQSVILDNGAETATSEAQSALVCSGTQTEAAAERGRLCVACQRDQPITD